ncbi:MAG: hypothetical protein U0931_27015 [Vulcanimicrobiota bacterium]
MHIRQTLLDLTCARRAGSEPKPETPQQPVDQFIPSESRDLKPRLRTAARLGAVVTDLASLTATLAAGVTIPLSLLTGSASLWGAGSLATAVTLMLVSDSLFSYGEAGRSGPVQTPPETGTAQFVNVSTRVFYNR